MLRCFLQDLLHHRSLNVEGGHGSDFFHETLLELLQLLMLRSKVPGNAGSHGLRSRLEAYEIRLGLRDMQEHDVRLEGPCQRARGGDYLRRDIGEVDRDENGLNVHGKAKGHC